MPQLKGVYPNKTKKMYCNNNSYHNVCFALLPLSVVPYIYHVHTSLQAVLKNLADSMIFCSLLYLLQIELSPQKNQFHISYKDIRGWLLISIAGIKPQNQKKTDTQ